VERKNQLYKIKIKEFEKLFEKGEEAIFGTPIKSHSIRK